MFRIPDSDGDQGRASGPHSFQQHSTDIAIFDDRNDRQENVIVTEQPTALNEFELGEMSYSGLLETGSNHSASSVLTAEHAFHHTDASGGRNPFEQGAEGGGGGGGGGGGDVGGGGDGRGRRHIPVSTIGWQSRDDDQFFPINGLDFLRGVEQVSIEQTMDLSDLTNSIRSEKRYLVRIPQGGETLYRGHELSENFQRSCFGSGRAFSMSLHDHTQQEVMCLKRNLACCSLFCQEKLEVWSSPGELLGTIEQMTSFSTPMFLVYDRHRNIKYQIQGPALVCGCIMSSKDIYFKVYTSDGLTQIGSINNQWDQLSTNYNLMVTFPSRRDDARLKALLLGAAFLFEYMYFERQK